MPTREMGDDELRAKVESASGETVREFVVFRNSDGKSFGYGWATYSDHPTALRAMRALQGARLGGNKTLSASLAVSRPKADPRELKKLKTLFVRGLPSNTQDAELTEFFGGDTVVALCKIPIDKNSQLPIGHAFVHFHTREQAEQALANNKNRDVRRLRACVRAAAHTARDAVQRC